MIQLLFKKTLPGGGTIAASFGPFSGTRLGAEGEGYAITAQRTPEGHPELVATVIVARGGKLSYEAGGVQFDEVETFTTGPREEQPAPAPVKKTRKKRAPKTPAAGPVSTTADTGDDEGDAAEGEE
jgi:hypothetical protein